MSHGVWQPFSFLGFTVFSLFLGFTVFSLLSSGFWTLHPGAALANLPMADMNFEESGRMTCQETEQKAIYEADQGDPNSTHTTRIVGKADSSPNFPTPARALASC